MNSSLEKIFISNFLYLSILFSTLINAQSINLVWADEFNKTNIDRSIWNFEYGTANDNVHYFTDRPENANVVDGKLHVIALKESYNGFNYTAALLKTHNSIFWKYGRIEARIKLPSSNGFVPAFWMLPQDHKYGYWPLSGEIDILEHPTNEVVKIYGTVHTGAYNSFTGSGPRGSNITIADAESEFHIYAIEWTPEKIDFFVDDQKYFTFNNENTDFEAWPFDQPFYIILSMGVGGGWVGDPDASSIFPAIMEVDYVRVYQQPENISITGPDELLYYSTNTQFSLPEIEGANYNWDIPINAQTIDEHNTHLLNTDWNIFGGTVKAEMTINNSSYLYQLPVSVSNNILYNSGFEKGVNHWHMTRPYPGDIDFILDSLESNTGKNSLSVDVKTPSSNLWDVQLSHRNLMLEGNKHYKISFYAKAKTNETNIVTAVINSSTFELYYSKGFSLTTEWEKYEYSFTQPKSGLGQLNIDMGGHLGTYYFDDFSMVYSEFENDNQISNYNFTDHNLNWVLNTFHPAQATGSANKGEYLVIIENGGSFLWDIHLGQENVMCENGKEYVVSFDAYADNERDISAIVGKNSDPWTVYSGSQIISLTKEKKTYSYSFVMNNSTDNEARLGFDIGNSSVNVYFDNVVLSKGALPTQVENEENLIEKSFYLFQNYPNPFNPSTKISYRIPIRSHVNLMIYNVLGMEVKRLFTGKKDAGLYTIEFDASNLSSGVYYFTLTVGDFIQTRKMMLVK